MEINILSKWMFDDIVLRNDITAERISKFVRSCFISIVSSKGEESAIVGGPNSIILKFDDLIDTKIGKRLEAEGEIILFNKTLSDKLFQFIKANQYKSQALIHCTAGVSRSGAVGSFIAEYLKKDPILFKRDNPNISPNELVLRLLRQSQEDDNKIQSSTRENA